MARMILAAMVFFLVQLPPAVAGGNLVPEGGFEKGLWNGANPTGQIRIEDRSVHEGKRSLRLVNGKREAVLRTVIKPLDGQKKYRVSAWIRTWGLVHNACFIRLSATLEDGTVKPVEYWYPEIGEPGFPDPGDKEKVIITGGSHDWHRFFTTMAPLSAGVKKVILEVGLTADSGSGKRQRNQATDEFGWLGTIDPKIAGLGVAWIDDLRIEEIGSWPADPPCKGEIHVNGEIGVQYFHGRAAEVDCTLIGFDPITMRASYQIIDGWGKTVQEKKAEPSLGPSGTYGFHVRHAGVGYFEINLYAQKDGREFSLARTSYGILPPASKDYYIEDINSPFGLWVVLWDYQKGDMSLRDIGVKWSRGALTWGHWKYKNNQWQEYEPNFAQREIDRFKSQGVNFLASGILRGTPKPLSSAPQELLKDHPEVYRAFPPARFSDMDDYVKRNFQVYQGYPKVWSAWNEPNYVWSWRAGTSEFVKYCEHFYALCKKYDPKVLVIGPIAGSWNVPYAEEFLRSGGNRCIDGIDIHFNSMAGDMENMDFAGAIRNLKSAMRKYGGEKPIWISEFGVNCYLPQCTELNQAWRMVKAHVIGLSEGVRTLMYHCAYEWMKPEKNIWEAGCSLVRRDVSPRPGFVAYGIMTRQLYKAQYRGRLKGLPADCVAHVFTREKEAIIVAWVKNKSTVEPWCKQPATIIPQTPITVSLRTKARQVTRSDLFGDVSILPTRDGRVAVCLGLAPVYLHLPLEQRIISGLMPLIIGQGN